MKINGEKIVLRPLRKLDAISRSNHANDKDIAKYTFVPHPYKLKDARDFIEKTKRNLKKKEAFELGIEFKETKEIIGMISLMKIRADLC